MLLVVARRHDQAAESLAARWKVPEVALLTARDLSEPGWEFKLPPRGPSRFIAGGRAFDSDALSGVLTLIPSTHPSELDHVAVEDRSYVSSEMTAFLLAWLSGLSCPILNPPTPGCLCGPAWRVEYWLHFAATLGIPVESMRRSTGIPNPEESPPERKTGGVVTMVGEQCLGSVHPALADYSRRLAAAARVPLLEVRFTGEERDARLLEVALSPDVSRPEVADAILNFFDSGPPC